MKNANNNSSHNPFRGIKNFFSQDPLWKLFSIIAAIGLWFVVMNTINPTEIKTFTAPVSFQNMNELSQRGYLVSNIKSFEDMSISVKVESTRPGLDELSKENNKNSIKAKIDLSKLEINDDDVFPKTYSVIITPVLPSSSYMYKYSIASYYPSVADIVIDKSDSKTVPVEIKTYGTPESGYVAGKAESPIKEVSITGPASILNTVENAAAVIDITGESGIITQNCKVSVQDDKGEAIDNFVISPESIPVTINIKKSSTLKIREPETRGALPQHLELASIDWSPKSINVTSDNENIPDEISLPPVNLAEIKGETTITADISDALERLNVEAESKETIVKITVKVNVKVAKKYTIPSSIIAAAGLSQGYEVTLPDSVAIEVGGVDNIDVNALAPSVDLTGLEEGKHTLPLKLNLPENAILKDNAEISVNIIKKDTADNPSETEQTTIAETTTLTPSENNTELN